MVEEPKSELGSWPAIKVFETLDLEHPELAGVRELYNKGDHQGALSALLSYYRKKYPVIPLADPLLPEEEILADDTVNHIFHWGPYEPADYGKDINWAWDPRDDIEWVAAIYRFYWLPPLMRAYEATRDDKYARAFVELTTDWIQKHPLEKMNMVHEKYGWNGFPWLDIQTGIRASNLSDGFRVFIHSESFTPEFLGVLLASLYDHQVKTERFPKGQAHNKAIFEQHGFVKVIGTVPEFKDAKRWMDLSLDITRENLLAQTTEDGVQREWCLSYHMVVLRDVLEILEIADQVGAPVPEDFRQRVRRMTDYAFALTTPDLGNPMFGDTARRYGDAYNRYVWTNASVLEIGSRVFKESRYAALARDDRKQLPEQRCYAFHDAGSYVLRNEWGPDQIYFAFHCPPKPLTGHDSPDNGTFELYFFGRWLMPDSGFYFYGHNAEGRNWHRRTKVHQTLTMGDQDSAILGKELLWQDGDDQTAVVVENQAYPNLLHRRSVWFVDKKFFVLLDEAIGSATEPVDLHFQLAPGKAELFPEKNTAHTLFEDANVLVCSDSLGTATMIEEEGWTSPSYGKREARKAFCYRFEKSESVRLLTLIVPYRGTEPPDCSVQLHDTFKPGDDQVEVSIHAYEKDWILRRDLSLRKAWAKAR